MGAKARHPGTGATGPAIGQHERGRRYRRHELALPDGGRLKLGVDGTIERIDADGSTTRSWPVTDPDWADQAIRFGLRPESPTVTPHAQRFADPRLPGA
jgi:hypothetical protein